MINLVEIILYVEDQQNSTLFYKNLLKQDPSLNVPGMTEFILNAHCKLGLMPNTGIAKILGSKTPHPSTGNGIPRCELYLYTDNITAVFENALACGATLIDNISQRDWGDKVCYFADPDGHIIAFAEKIKS
ncbi:MAG: VOC family protein [Bacteroidia bacterium]